MAYGLKVYNASQRLLFDSTKPYRGTFVVSKGTVSSGNSVTFKAGDFLFFNITGNGVVLGETTVNTFDTPQTMVTTFYIQGTSHFTATTNTINYVVLRDMANTSGSGNYGLVCRDAGAYAVGPITFDSRVFKSTSGEIEIDPNQSFSYSWSHGTWIAYNMQGGDQYICASNLRKSSMTYYVKNYGVLFHNATSGRLYSEGYYQYQIDNGFGDINAVSYPGLKSYVFQEFITYGGYMYNKPTVSPYFIAKKSLGAYEG